MQAGIERSAATQLIKTIREFDADRVICTHFLPTPLLDRERKKGRIRARIITVVTDLDVHGMWLSAPSDHYFVATEEARVYLEALQISAADITVGGIPTHPIFAEKKDRVAMRRKHSWDPEMPAILVSAGGFGAGNAGRLVEALVTAGVKAQIIAVCGAPLKAAIEKIALQPTGVSIVKAVGFTTEMDELMSAADLMIGKSGGLTTSESLIKGVAWWVARRRRGRVVGQSLHAGLQGEMRAGRAGTVEGDAQERAVVGAPRGRSNDRKICANLIPRPSPFPPHSESTRRWWRSPFSRARAPGRYPRSSG